MATNTRDMGDSQPSATGATIDWDAAFQLTEFLSGLQTILCLNRIIWSSWPTLFPHIQLHQERRHQGMFNAPSFVSAISGSVTETSSSIPPHQP